MRELRKVLQSKHIETPWCKTLSSIMGKASISSEQSPSTRMKRRKCCSEPLAKAKESRTVAEDGLVVTDRKDAFSFVFATYILE